MVELALPGLKPGLKFVPELGDHLPSGDFGAVFERQFDQQTGYLECKFSLF